jgi:undecaprenyl-diphosphatase
MSIIAFDRLIVTACDTLLFDNRLFRVMVYTIGENPLVRNLPVFLPLLFFWFSNTSIERRGRIVTGILATCMAVFISVAMQYLFQVHTRPLLDPTLHLHIASPNWDHQSSFPSDTAMLYFALSTVLLLLNRSAGVAAFIWSIFSAGVCRVAIGWHYPSDIAGSLVIAPSVVLLICKPALIRNIIEKLLTRYQEKMPLFNALLMFFLADAYNLFPGLRGIAETLVRLLRRNLDIPE